MCMADNIMPARSSQNGSTRLKPQRAEPLFNQLRNILAALPETGDDGFEGLVAAACTQLVSVPFRLVGSGRQFGLDAEGPPNSGAILVEAKHYTSRLSYGKRSVKAALCL
ncbi:hypothetical protein mvi_61800 (plasmid) [Methylobacterium indicum]|uniref:Uncharacterized protein n=1 Tax=Methylobacterium indicum TaxID=1775910 RepID=A0A8H8X0C5_9HYPH|nr:hypothetical protein mvi_61800 [Methylobacterium indicum]